VTSGGTPRDPAVLGMKVTFSPQLPWYVARACGLVGWALAWLSVVWGVALSTRALGRRVKAPWLDDLHRFLGALTAMFVALHLLGLALDTYVPFGPRQLFVPFATHWRPAAVAWGIAAFYLLLAIEVTSLLMKRIPRRLWHGVHLCSYLLAVTASIHLLTAGTDRHTPLLRGVAIALPGCTLFFLVYRWIGPGRVASIRAGAKRARPNGAASRGAADRPVAGGEGQHHAGAARRRSVEAHRAARPLGRPLRDVQSEPGRAGAAGAPLDNAGVREPGSLVVDDELPRSEPP
jgi:DMSO/TMAO reductase YedYZ heme-binding membrane subunit